MRVMRRRASFIGAAMPERIECIDDRSLLIADHPHFLEIFERVQPELGGPLGVRKLPRPVRLLDLILIRHAVGPYICDPAHTAYSSAGAPSRRTAPPPSALCARGAEIPGEAGSGTSLQPYTRIT